MSLSKARNNSVQTIQVKKSENDPSEKSENDSSEKVKHDSKLKYDKHVFSNTQIKQCHYQKLETNRLQQRYVFTKQYDFIQIH